MIKRFNITVLDGQCLAVMSAHSEGSYVRYADIARLLEEKTLEQHREGFEAFQQHDLERCNEGFYISISTMIAWSVWQAARGL